MAGRVIVKGSFTNVSASARFIAALTASIASSPLTDDEGRYYAVAGGEILSQPVQGTFDAATLTWTVAVVPVEGVIYRISAPGFMPDCFVESSAYLPMPANADVEVDADTLVGQPGGDTPVEYVTLTTVIAAIDSKVASAVAEATAESIAADPAVIAAAAALAASGVGLARMETGKNLYNPDDAGVQTGYVLSASTGSLGQALPSALYITTGHIPVTGGVTLTLSNPRLVAFYDATGTVIPGSVVDHDSTTLTVTAPASAATLRASYKTTYATFQVEEGAAATAWEPYVAYVAGVTENGMASQAKATADALAAKLAGYTLSPNLYDHATSLADTILGTLGVNAAYTGYTTSAFIPVQAGKQYTTTARHVSWYSAAAESGYLGRMTADNAALAPVTDTAPGGATHARIDALSTAMPGTMFVEGTALPATFQPYGAVTIDGLRVPGRPTLLTTSGSSVAIDTTLGGSSLTITARTARPDLNRGFNLDKSIIDGTSIHSAANAVGDEVTPIRTQMGTLGANHGHTCVTTLTNPDGKDATDLGSVWTDGSREYVILAVDAAKVTVGGSYTVTSGVVSSDNAQPTTDLTHVSGATHTAAMAASTKAAVGAVQLYPSTARRMVAVILDGAPVTTDGQRWGREVTIRESYEILDYRSLYDTVKANPGVHYTTLSIDGAVRVQNTFRFGPAGRGRVSTVLTELAPTTLKACGGVQSIIPVLADRTLVRYVPGVGTIGGRAWANGVDMTTYSANDIVTTADLLDPAKPPAFTLDRVHNAGTTMYGFALGYLPYGVRDSDATTSAARLAAAPTNLWDLRSTKKSYPTAFTSKTAGWGRITMESFRTYLTAQQTDAVIAAGPDAGAAWAALDTQAGLT